MAYDLEAMKRAVLACDANIKVFEAAIAKEQATKIEYQGIVRFLQEQEAAERAAKAALKRAMENAEVVGDGDED